MQVATLSSKYQIVIPKAIREDLNFQAGQRFIFLRKGNILMMVPQTNVKNLRGALAGANTENYRDHNERV